MTKQINTTLPANKCWDMVNKIQLGRTPEEIRQRCNTAESWLRANTILTADEFDELMEAVACLYRESYRL